MNDMNETEGRKDRRTDVTSLRLPIQSAPVYRSTLGGAKTASGVEPSDWFDVAKTALDIGGKIAAAW